MLVGPAGERVEEQLEPDAARGPADRAHQGDVGAGERHGVVRVLGEHLHARRDGVDVGVVVALGGEGRRLGGEDAPQLQRAAHQLVPRGVGQLEALDQRPEHLEPGPLAPRRHDRAGAVPRRHEAEGLEPPQRRP